MKPRRHTPLVTFSRALAGAGLIVGAAVSMAACSTQEAKLKPGRCNYNSDCLEGFHCVDTYCEDIYFPRREIKPY